MTEPETVTSTTIPARLSSAEQRLLFQDNRLLGRLPPPVLAALEQQGRRRQLADGDCIYARGDAPDGLYGLLRGSARISNFSAEGREAVLAVLNPGSWFGEVSMFDGLPRSHDTHARGSTELLLIPRAAFHQLLVQFPALYPVFTELLCRRLRLSFSLQEDTTLLPLAARLAKRLVMHARNYGQSSRPSNVQRVTLSQESLAQMLNSSRQQVNRLLKRMEAAGWVTLRYRSVELRDPAALNQVASGQRGLPPDSSSHPTPPQR